MLPLHALYSLRILQFAGGAMIALACDFRIMSECRGYLCINEVDIGLPLTPGK